jgi:tetratricopeptide (TPR) repeat protein
MPQSPAGSDPESGRKSRQAGAGQPKGDPSEPEAFPLEDADLEEEVDEDLGTIDQLLAQTDQGWDIEAQVKTLKAAAATRPIVEASGAVDASRPLPSHALHLPTPFDLATTRFAPNGPGSRVLEESGSGRERGSHMLGEGSAAALGVEPSPSQRPGAKKPAPPAPASRRGSTPPPPTTARSEPSPVRQPADMSQPGALVDLLQARVTTLEASGDKVGLARAHMELAIASEAILGDDARAILHAEAALKVEPMSSAAHAILRRKKHARAALGAMLNHLEHELVAATTEAHKVELLAEKARLFDAAGDRPPGGAVGTGGAGRAAGSRAVWEQALALAPNHAAALKGLEAELVDRALANDTTHDWDALAVHLGRMADAYGSEPRLAAWLHVERAQILERKLGLVDAARGAFQRALDLDGTVGPVRDALVRHAAVHADWGGLARLLEQEAGIEPDGTRAARLELDAAAICAARLGDRARATSLLERAAARAPTAGDVDRRVLDELVRLHESEGRWGDAARARRARLRFVADGPAMAYELRTLATSAEKAGDLETAIADVQRALAAEAADPTLVELLDRLLSATAKQDQRIAMWLQEAARTEDGTRRARALSRAAAICEELGRRADAVRHLRSAWVAAPGDAEVLDALARLLAPAFPEVRRTPADGAQGTPPEPVDAGVRSLVELYSQAAEQARDPGRRVAYLEKVALLWEEVLGDPARAARTYELILELDRDRRGALLGLERTSARTGNPRALARALLDEGRVAADGPTRLALRARAAAALAKIDPARAGQLVREVLYEDPAHTAARTLETRLEEDAGRWELAAKSLQARIDIATTPSEKVALWLALAQLQHARLGRPLDAMQSLEHAHSLDPAHPVPPEEIARVLEDHGDPRALRDAIERLAARARAPEDRVRYLARAAEIDELRLGDDASAARTYQRALAEAPDCDLVAERLTRVVARRAQHTHNGGLGDLASLLGKRIERAASPVAAQAMSFELAALFVEAGEEPARAAALLEGALAQPGDRVPALRTLESLRRRSGDAAGLARVLAAQGSELKDVCARLGALWNLAALEEWTLPAGDPAHTYQAILALDPTDPGALDATLRRELVNARRGDPDARATVIAALRSLVPFASDEDTRLVLQLRLAFLLETAADEMPDPHAVEESAREALGRYRDALRIDELSVTASTSLARLASRLLDTEAAFAAATSLAELAVDPRVRARYLVDGAELLLGPDETAGLGSAAERHTRACAMLERALAADADSIPAAGRLATVLLEDGQGERLVSAFRGVLGRAKSPDAVVMLGSEIARVARDDLHDLPVAIDAMRRVRAAAPQHVPSLLTLSELCIAQRVWPEAVDALEAVVSTSREAAPKLTALFALASIYEKVLSRPRDVDRVLRAALAVEPGNARALRALLRRIAAEPVADDPTATRRRREEVAELLARLADAEKDPEQKTGILLELGEIRQRLGDPRGTEQALVLAVATSPSNTRAFARLGSLFRGGQGGDSAAYARALASVIGKGQELGHIDARWFAALGTLEIQQLQRLRDGVVHLQRAVALDPTLHEARFELASALARVGANDEATRVLMGMISPLAHPFLSLADPAAGLALLEQTLSADRRAEEAVVVSELRATAGELDDARASRLRARRPSPADVQGVVLERAALVTHVLPHEGRHILLEVAAAIAGIEAKVLRTDLGELGVSSRDRLTSRSGHPTRLALDRVARQLGVGEVELAVAPGLKRTRVVAQDVPWIVVPASLTDQSEMVQIATLGRAAARIAYGVPWLEELPPLHIIALLVAAARQVVPGYASDPAGGPSASLVAQSEIAVVKALSRRQRKLLDELAPHIASPQARPIAADAFVDALTRAELRTAFVLTGDLLTMIETIRPLDSALYKATEAPGPRALAAVLEDPIAGDVVRFALTPEATALRRRVGSTWS